MEKKTKNLLSLVVKLLVSSGVLYLVIKKAGLQSLGEHLKRVNLFYFFFASFLYVLSIYVSSIRWKVLLWNHRDVSVGYLFKVYITGSFFSTVLPGIIGGDALRIYYLHKKGIGLSEAAGSTFLDRYTGYIGLLLTALVGAIMGSVQLQAVAVVFSLTVLFVLATVVVLRFRFGRRLLKLEGFYNYFREFFGRGKTAWASVVLSIVIQVIIVISVYVVVRATGQTISIWSLFVYMTIIITASTVPVSISGLGIREWAFVALFGLNGFSPGASTAVSLLWYLSYVLGSLTGLGGYILLKTDPGWSKIR